MESLPQKITVYFVFEDEKRNPATRESLYDLVDFDKRKDDSHCFYLDAVPSIGETLEVRSQIGVIHFVVLAVHHQIYSNLKETQYVKLLLRLVPFNEVKNQ